MVEKDAIVIIMDGVVQDKIMVDDERIVQELGGVSKEIERNLEGIHSSR